MARQKEVTPFLDWLMTRYTRLNNQLSTHARRLLSNKELTTNRVIELLQPKDVKLLKRICRLSMLIGDIELSNQQENLVNWMKQKRPEQYQAILEGRQLTLEERDTIKQRKRNDEAKKIPEGRCSQDQQVQRESSAS